jgi:hypothetical protein
MTTTFTLTVKAATDETSSKFALAEALAKEIPPRKPGPRLVGDERGSLTETLKDVRQEIIDAGGEERSIRILNQYRLTALWVREGERFRWIPKTSFSAHSESRNAGMTYEDFAGLKPEDRKVNRLRDAAKWVTTEGGGTKTSSLNTEQVSEYVEPEPERRESEPEPSSFANELLALATQIHEMADRVQRLSPAKREKFYAELEEVTSALSRFHVALGSQQAS